MCDAAVVLSGHYGGTIFLTVPVARLRCDLGTLQTWRSQTASLEAPVFQAERWFTADAGTGWYQQSCARSGTMQVDKEQIISLLRERGDDAKADQAQQELPSQVDTDQDSALLAKIGIDPSELLGGLGGTLGL